MCKDAADSMGKSYIHNVQKQCNSITMYTICKGGVVALFMYKCGRAWQSANARRPSCGLYNAAEGKPKHFCHPKCLGVGNARSKLTLKATRPVDKKISKTCADPPLEKAGLEPSTFAWPGKKK